MKELKLRPNDEFALAVNADSQNGRIHFSRFCGVFLLSPDGERIAEIRVLIEGGEPRFLIKKRGWVEVKNYPEEGE